MIIFNKITKTEAYVELTTENGEKHIIPTSDVIFVNDESGFVSIKNTGSRKTIGLISEEEYDRNPDEPEHYKVWGYLTDGSVYVIEENGYSVLTSEETRSYRDTMATAIIGTGVTELGNQAFMHNRNLTSITIPNSVTSIGNSVLYSCSNLTSVTIPNSVTTIGDRVFYECSSLTSVTIGSSVTTIGDRVFHGCSSLTSIIIPNSVTSIGNYAFNNCSSLTSVTMSDGITSSLYGIMGNSSVQILYVSCEQFNREKENVTLRCIIATKPNYECNLDKTYSKTMTDGTKIDCYVPLMAASASFLCIDSEIVTTLDIYQDIDIYLGHNMRVPANINVYSENAKISENSLYIKPSGFKEGIKNLYFSYTYNTFNEDIIIPSTVETLELYFRMTHPCDVPPKNIVMNAIVPPELKNIGISYSSSGSACPSTIRNIMIYVPDASVDAYKAAPNWSDYADRIKPMSEYQE